MELPAPIDGGSWHYQYSDGTIESAFSQGQEWDSTYVGRVTPFHRGPYTPGTTERGLVEEFIPSSRDGDLVFLNWDREIVARLEVPAESVNEGDETIQQIYSIARDFDGEIALRR